MTREQAKRWARRNKIAFRELETIYRELRAVVRNEREWEWTIRREAWERQTPPGCHEFWRHGFHVRYRHAFTDGDRGNIPGFDETAADMATRFPELETDGDPAAKLFELLAQPHRTLPTSEETWDEAIRAAETGLGAAIVDEAVPF